MRILFDTNVILDVLLDRQPFSNVASELFSRVESNEILGYLCGTTVTTIHYLTTQVIGKKQTQNVIRKLLDLFEIAPVNRLVLESASTANFSDFEDAVLYESARQIAAEAIVTRNIRDFKAATIPVYRPRELMDILQSRAT